MSAVPVTSAALRLPRTVAVRRALLAGLFLAGFVALGFAFGSGAHAADRGPATTQLTAPARQGAHLGEQRAGSVQRAGNVQRARLSAGERAASGTVTRTVRPAAERTAPVTDPVAAPVREAVGDVPEPTGDALPVDLPTGDDSGHTGDNGDADDTRHTGCGGNGGAAGQGCGSQGARTDGARDSGGANARVSGHGVGPSAAAATDPRNSAAEHGGSAVPEQRDQDRDGRHLPGQLPQGPAAPTAHTAGDGHGPRDGDQHAAVPADPTRFRLLPGGVRTADGAPTRRRAEDILEFPG